MPRTLWDLSKICVRVLVKIDKEIHTFTAGRGFENPLKIDSGILKSCYFVVSAKRIMFRLLLLKKVLCTSSGLIDIHSFTTMGAMGWQHSIFNMILVLIHWLVHSLIQHIFTRHWLHTYHRTRNRRWREMPALNKFSMREADMET